MQTRTPHVSSLAPLVLLVDDDEDSRGLYAEYLTSTVGYRVAEAADGRQAVEAAGELGPDVIVMDLTLPVLDGREAMLALRADPKTSAIPIVALDGARRAQELERGGDGVPGRAREAVPPGCACECDRVAPRAEGRLRC